MFQDQAKQQKTAEEEQAAIIAKQKAENEMLKAQANQQKAENEILKAKAAKCKCEAFGKVKQMPQMPAKSFIKSTKIVGTHVNVKITGTMNIPSKKTLDEKSVQELSKLKLQ